MTDVERETVLPAAPEEVWDAFADPERLGEWFGADVDGDVEPGESVRFTWPDGSKRRAVIERVEPEKRLVFRWIRTPDDPASRVEITIDEVGDDTLIRVTETRVEAAVSPTHRIGFRALART